MKEYFSLSVGIIAPCFPHPHMIGAYQSDFMVLRPNMPNLGEHAILINDTNLLDMHESATEFVKMS